MNVEATRETLDLRAPHALRLCLEPATAATAPGSTLAGNRTGGIKTDWRPFASLALTSTWRIPGEFERREYGTAEGDEIHRYYDPSIGRYLQPEPMIQKPMYMKLLAGQGRSLQAYAYARNNPVRFGDATGQELEGDKDSCSPEAQKVIKKLRDKIKKGLPAGKCKKLLDDVGIIDLVDSDTVYTIICTKEEKLPNCDGSGESTTPDACGAADAENRCATVREKGSKLGCPGIEETVLHETAHLCGPWPVGTPHVEGDDALYKRIERCAVEIAGSR